MTASAHTTEKLATLSVVATPIGNLQDLSPRARDTLSRADLWLVEDTRVSQKLQVGLGVKVRMQSCFEQKERVVAERLMKQLFDSKEHWCLLSDAGTPAISDPGSFLVEQAHLLGIQVVPIPGASALTTLLSASGFKQGDVVFLGFLERKKEDLLRQLRSSLSLTAWRRIVFFESPHRIESTLALIAQNFAQIPQMVIGRELTKLYEQVVRGTPEDLLKRLEAGEIQKRGEFVCALEFPPLGELSKENHSEAVVKKLFEKGLSAKDIFELNETLGLELTLNRIRDLANNRQ